MDKPTPERIKAARAHAMQTAEQAAALVHTDGRTWRRWELGPGFASGRAMPLASWELYLMKGNYIDDYLAPKNSLKIFPLVT